MPAGKEVCKEWIHVAAAVVGLVEQSTTEEKKKATRGICGEPKPAQAQETTKKAKKEKISRKYGTGVVHLVSNKIRLRDQKHGLDGNNPSFFIVPVMELEKAKNWKGES